MEYWNLVLDVFGVALGWWTQIISADSFLLYVFLGLIFANMVTQLFIMPFASTLWQGGPGSDFARSIRKKSKSNSKPQSKSHD